MTHLSWTTLCKFSTGTDVSRPLATLVISPSLRLQGHPSNLHSKAAMCQSKAKGLRGHIMRSYYFLMRALLSMSALAISIALYNLPASLVAFSFTSKSLLRHARKQSGGRSEYTGTNGELRTHQLTAIVDSRLREHLVLLERTV